MQEGRGLLGLREPTWSFMGREAGISLPSVVFPWPVLLKSLGGTTVQGRVVRRGEKTSEFSAVLGARGQGLLSTLGRQEAKANRRRGSLCDL